MDDYADDIAAVAKGHKTIAEALKELEAVKEAFLRSSRIETKILQHDDEISEIKSKMNLLSTYSYVNSKNNEFYNCVESIVKSKLDEYTFQVMFELSKKVDEKDLKKQLDSKISSPEFFNLKNSLASTKLKLDTYLDIELPAHKAKIQSSLLNLAGGSEKMTELTENIEKLAETCTSFESQIRDLKEKVSQSPKVEKQIEHIHHKKIIEVKNQEVGGSSLLYDKIEDIEKNISSIFNESLSSRTKFLYVEEVVKSILKQLEKLISDQNKLEKMVKKQETHFIECLRLKDMQNELKKDRIKVEKMPDSEVKKLHKEIQEKNKRIVIVENNLKHFVTEVEFLKTLHKDLKAKFVEIEKEKTTQGLKVFHLKQEIGVLETSLNESVQKSAEGIGIKKFVDSDEQRAKRSWENIKGMSAQDFFKPASPNIVKKAVSRKLERVVNFSPRINRYK